MYCLYFFNLSLTWKTRMQHKWQNQACPWWPCVLPTEALSDEQNIRWSLKQAENIEGQVVLLSAYVLYNIPRLDCNSEKRKSCSFLWQKWARKQCTDALTITVLKEKEHMTKIKYDKDEWHMTIRSDQISRSVVSNSLQLHESQHARPPCPSPNPGVHPDSRPSSQ